MTKRNPKRPGLKRLRSKAVEVDFKGGRLTSDGGLLLLREVDRRLNLIHRIDQAIVDPRDLNYTTHSQAEILASRIFAIAAGYEDANDQQQLRDDPVFQVAAGRTPKIDPKSSDEEDPTLASPATHSRFENRVDSKAIFEMHEILVDTFLDSYDSPPNQITLDYDATDDTVHGDQEKKAFNAYYDSYCFQPLYVFCGDQLLVSYLRPANQGDAHHARGITKLLVQKIRSRWPDVKIILRGDGGFSLERLMRWCDKNDVGYVFGLPKNDVLIRNIACEMTRARIAHAALGGTQAVFKWFRYRTARTWDRHRWVVGKAEYTNKGANPRFIVTNLFSSAGVIDATYHRPMVNGKRQPIEIKTPGIQCSAAMNPEKFYSQWYCMRGEMENRIKEQQLCLFADRTSCSRFQANQFRLMLSSFAYVLVDGLRRLALQGTKHSRLRVDTIRLRLLKIAARVRVTHRRVVFHLCSQCPWASLFDDVMLRLCRSD
jgi:hypothetical protein